MAIRYGLLVRTAGTATGGPGFTRMVTAACVAPGTGSRTVRIASCCRATAATVPELGDHPPSAPRVIKGPSQARKTKTRAKHLCRARVCRINGFRRIRGCRDLL